MDDGEAVSVAEPFSDAPLLAFLYAPEILFDKPAVNPPSVIRVVEPPETVSRYIVETAVPAAQRKTIAVTAIRNRRDKERFPSLRVVGVWDEISKNRTPPVGSYH